MNVTTISKNHEISHNQLSEMTGKRSDSVKRTMESLNKSGVIQLTQSVEVNHKGQSVNVYRVNERDSYVVIAQLCPEYTARLVDYWMGTKNSQPVSLPSTKQLALMVIQAEEEKEAALLQLESKTQQVAQLESLFHSGGTIAQFVKQLNGVNSQRVNVWLYENTSWLYDDNKGKIYLSGPKQGTEKPYSWRCAAYARDKYLTESPKEFKQQGSESFTKYEVRLLAGGKKWLFNKYIKNELPMKANWDGKFTHDKDLN